MNAGDVVLLRFPFSDLSGSKLRPAVLHAEAGRADLIACQVTSNRDADPAAVELTAASFAVGSLRVTSYARPGKLFTAHQSLIAKRVARVTDPVKERIRDAPTRVNQNGTDWNIGEQAFRCFAETAEQ
jgi:mRNA interferase MazF